MNLVVLMKILVQIFFLSLSVLAGERPACVRFFEFQPIAKIPERGHVLGAGQNGEVKLLSDGKSKYVVKAYHSKSDHRTSQIQSDLRAFRYLEKYKARFSFELPLVKYLGANEIQMSYHEGRTVDELLKDKKTNAEVKEKIEKAYAKLLSEIEATLHHFDHVEKKDGILVAEDDQLAMGPFHFIIKKDNVIVNPETLRLTLIDPH